MSDPHQPELTPEQPELMPQTPALPSERSGQRNPHTLGANKELMERLGIDPADLEGEPPVEGPEWIAHRRFEEKHPDIAHMQLSAVMDKRRQWVADGNALDDFKPHREFPCGGMLRMQDLDMDMPTVTVMCDACRYTVAISRETATGGPSSDRLLERTRLPVSFIGRPMEQDVEGQERCRSAAREYVTDWPKSDLKVPGVGFFGEPGRGKSHLLCQVTEWLVRQHSINAVYWPMAELLETLRSSYDEGRGCPEWERALKVELLALDDIGAERLTDWSKEKMGILIDYRYRDEKPILTASNVHPDKWDDVFGARIGSRLRGLVLSFEMKGEDQRPKYMQAAGTS